jgi:predicted enzyme related to lactoylglutathione lyase
MNSIVHFEIPVNSPEEAKKFYTETFDWSVEQWEQMPYWMATTTEMDDQNKGPKNVGAINGGMTKREGVFQHPILTIAVDDIDAALAKIEAAGGKKLQDKNSIGEMGFTAYFEDNQGNTMGLWQNTQKSE